MIRWMVLLLACCATLASAQSSPARKELVAKLITLQQSVIEDMAKTIAERPVFGLGQQASAVLRTLPADKRDEAAKTIDAAFRAYIEQAAPLVRERALKLAPATEGPMLEEKLSEDELRQLIAWFESPVRKKYEQLWPDLSKAMVQKLVDDISPVLEPKLSALQDQVAATLRAAGAKIPQANAAKPVASGAKPASAAAKPAAKAASK